MRGRRWGLEEFFRTGEEELAGVLAEARELGRPTRRGRALDFGCGVGRVTRAMTRVFERCVGVDVSPAMIEHARELNRDLPNCAFLVSTGENGLGAFDDGSLDFAYAGFVLQHLPGTAAIESAIGELLRVVRHDGLLVFQLPEPLPLRSRLQPRRRLYTLARAGRVPEAALIDVLKLHPIRMRGMDVERVERVVGAYGGVVRRRTVVDPDSAISGWRFYASVER